MTTIPFDSTTDLQITSALKSSTPHTIILSDVTTTVNELKWNSTGITVASENGNSSIISAYGVFVDDQYYIYIAEIDNNGISKWPPNPYGLTSAAVFQTASGQLNAPKSLYVNTTTGDIYVANEQNRTAVVLANG